MAAFGAGPSSLVISRDSSIGTILQVAPIRCQAAWAVVAVKSVSASAGNRVCLETAVDYVMRATPRYRLPETTRQADRLGSARD
ncbi:MAG: hypothetical protein GY856_27370 [bacterium]|nr:hypothetical protein [bacterium]